MRARLVRIGNSRGVRLPKAVIDQVGLDEDIDPPMLRTFAAQGLDVEPIASALEALRPITSLERWIAEYQPVAATFLNPLTERLGFVAVAQRARWRLRNVQYAELRLVQEAFSLSEADLGRIFQDSLLAAFPSRSTSGV